MKNLHPYVPGEQPKDRDYIKINANENPYAPSPKVQEAVINFVKNHPDVIYASIDYRTDFENKLLKYLMKLDKIKPVIYCGDLNVAHKEIDLKNPDTNHMNAAYQSQLTIRSSP